MSELREPRRRPGRPLVKICGVTRPQDAVAAIELGADLLGLNFYAGSPRCLIDPEDGPDRALEPARRLVRAARGAVASAARPPVLLVGVFVNEDPERVEEIAGALELDLVQLHGDEEPAAVARFGDRAIRVFRSTEPPAAEELERTPEAWGFLFDVPRGSASAASGSPRDERYGGTGEQWQYEMLRTLEAERPVLVAGGVRPGNARRALDLSGADGVDVCSGVEGAPGIKDPDRMRRLFEEVRHGAP